MLLTSEVVCSSCMKWKHSCTHTLNSYSTELVNIAALITTAALISQIFHCACNDDRLFNENTMFISHLCSSVGGLILDKTVTNPNFAGMAVFTPVINGKESYNRTDNPLVFASGKVGGYSGREQDTERHT